MTTPKILSVAIAACVLLGEVEPPSLRAQSLLPAESKLNARFDFRHYESLPEGRKVKEAQAEVERLFPPGSSADQFESYFEASDAKCTRGTDSNGPYVGCIYSMSGFFLVVTTDWTVGARLESTLSNVTTVQVTRYLTGP
jgi:hypothetical protein